MRLSIFSNLLVTTVVLSATVSGQQVKLPNGATITGTITTNVQGKKVQVFKGIRYAEAPIGDKRWRAVGVAPPITGSYSATAFGSACLSGGLPPGQPPSAPGTPLPSVGTMGFFTPAPAEGNVTGTLPPSSGGGGAAPPGLGGAKSEDCLFLNIYTPEGVTPNAKLPVMMWTHGGAFVMGSGDSFDGSNLIGAANQKIVFVSFNYRLGLMGFFSNEHQLKEGDGANFGLRDQEVAYQWVKHNIQYFGGNPKDITAFGESAGAQSIALQLIAREGKQKLFHKAISESGAYTSFHDTLMPKDQAAYTTKLAAAVNCTVGPALLACLRGVDAIKLMTAGGSFEWRPTVDGVFLKDMPLFRVRSGMVSPIPTILGTNTNEGWMFAASVSTAADFVPFLKANFKWLTSDEIEWVQALYPSKNFASERLRAAEVFGDAVFVCPSERMAHSIARYARGPATFHYRFNQSVANPFGGGPATASHGAEIDFVFNNVAKLVPDVGTKGLVQAMQQYWINFARTGSPNRPVSPSVTWPKYDPIRKQQIVLQAEQLKVETNGAYMPRHDERCHFWFSVDERMALIA